MRPRYQILISFFASAVVIAAMGGVKTFQIMRAMAQGASFKIPPEAVTSIVTKETSWQRTLGAVGSLAPVQGATLSVEEAGRVAKILFESGKSVNAGDVLVELDVSVEEANLRAAQAKLQLSRQNFARASNLRVSNAMSKADLDNAQAELDSSGADLESLKAQISRKKVIAPFGGQTGIRMVNIGQYVQAGTPIVPLYSLQEMYLDFSLPERFVSDLKVGHKINFMVDSVPNRTFEGVISAFNPQIDNATRTVMVRATTPNPDNSLRPGMYARVDVVTEHSQSFIVVPSSSIAYAPFGDSVYVIEQLKDENGQPYRGVRQQIVELGEHRGDQVAVLTGLKPDQQIVTSGVFKLRPGLAVEIQNEVSPGNDPSPKPADT